MASGSGGVGLVLGGIGFLGTWVIEEARAPGTEVLSPGRRELDLSQPDAVARWMGEVAVDWVLNCAALSRASNCERDPDRAQQLNAALPGELARVCAERKIRLVHVSTDMVFDGEPSGDAGFTELDDPGPLSVYGTTKVAGERNVLEANPAALVVRLPLLYGDSRGRGSGATDSLIAALERGERPKLFRDEFRTPLDIREAARALIELAHDARAGILHGAGPDRLWRLDLGRLAAGDQRIESTTRAELNLTPPRARDLSLDSQLARSFLKVRLSSRRRCSVRRRSTQLEVPEAHLGGAA